MRHTIYLLLSLVFFWVLNSSHNSPLMLSLGAASIAFVIYIAHRMDVVDHESQPVHLSMKLPGYLLWLLKELVVSNIAVVKHIWRGNGSISPTFTSITASQKTDIGKVIYANSITMTPGTVAVDLKGNQIMVHALVDKNIAALKTGEMDRRVSQLESTC
jgi:multicomponent Na+:H+ antiporter subunit E